MTTTITTTTTDTKTLRRLKPGTLVVSNLDGEPGTIVEVCSRRRNGVDARSYVVATAYGREVWNVGDFFLPDPDQN